MVDIRFDCPACGQPMVADESGSGESIACPHCSRSVQIPLRGIPVVESPELISEIVSLRNQREKLTSGLQYARTQLEHVTAKTMQACGKFNGWEKQRDSLSAALAHAKQELDKAQTQIEALRAERKHLSASVAVVAELNKEKAKLQDAQVQLDAAKKRSEKLSNDLRQAQTELGESREKLAKSQGNGEKLADELAETKMALEQSQVQADVSRTAHDKLQSEFDRIRTESAETRNRLEEAEAERAKSSGELCQTRNSLDETQKLVQSLQSERDKLVEELKETRSELADCGENLRAVQKEREKAAGELAQANARIANQAKAFSALEKKHEILATRFKRTKDGISEAFQLRQDDSQPGQLSEGEDILSEECDPPIESAEPNLQDQNEFLTSIIARMNDERSRHSKELESANTKMGLLARGVILFVVFVVLVSFYIAWLGSKSLTVL